MSLLDFSIVRWIQRYSVQSGHSRILLHLGLVTALAAAGFIATSVESSGHFFPQVKQADGTMGPAPDYAYGRRHLYYEISERMGRDTNFSSWVRQAVANWNSVSSKTGWKFVPCKKGDKPNVRFDFADKTDGTSASSNFGGNHGEEFHIYILRDVTGLNANGKVSGGYMGWGEKGATTLDPVLVIMHEMTHAMRLDHAAGAGWSTGNLEEPIGVGKHDGRTPSADDITQASASATDGKLPPTVSYTLLQCYPDAKALAKALDELRKMRKTARDEYDAAAKITTPRPRESGENSGQYNLYLEEFNAGNKEAKATAAKAQGQALSNIEYIENLIAAALGRICPPPATATPSHSSRLNAPEGPMQSGSEGFYAGLGGGMRSTACNNWHTKRVESTPGVDDAIGENPDACFSTAGRVSVYVGYTWSVRNNFMAGIETDAGYSNANTTRRGIPGTVGSIVSAAGSVNDSVNVKENWDGSVRGRLGYNVDAATTVYATTGLAWQQLHATITCGGGTGICGSAGLTPFSASQSTTRVGWTLGGGAEVKLWGPWAARAEYRYSDYGTYTATYGTRNTLGITSDINLRTHTALVGITMKLGR